MPERGRFEDDSVMMTRTSHGLEASLTPLAGGRGKEREGREGEGPDGGRGGGKRGGEMGNVAFPRESSSNHPRIILAIILESSSNHPRNHPRIILAIILESSSHPQIILAIILESS